MGWGKAYSVTGERGPTETLENSRVPVSSQRLLSSVLSRGGVTLEARSEA